MKWLQRLGPENLPCLESQPIRLNYWQLGPKRTSCFQHRVLAPTQQVRLFHNCW